MGSDKKCRRCGGVMHFGVAFENEMVGTMGVPDFPGDTIDTPGQTITLKPASAKLVKVWKCKACGHSVKA